MKLINFPLTEDVCHLNSGDKVLINGQILVFRDQAHKRLVSQIEQGQDPGFEIFDQAIFYASPTPTKPGEVSGSIGPTTSARMDKFTPPLLDGGVKVLIGKGPRSTAVEESLVKNKAIYLVTAGGAAAFLSKTIKKVKIIAYQDLGPEAVHLIVVKNFPAIVAIDCYGNNIFE